MNDTLRTTAEIAAWITKGLAPGKDRAIEACQSSLAENALSISREDAMALLSERDEHLSRVQRIERGVGILPELVSEFAGSQYLSQPRLVDQLSGLQEAFYSVRDDAPSYVSDAEILTALRRAFDGSAGGDADYLIEMDARSVLAMLDLEPSNVLYDGFSWKTGSIDDDSEWNERAKGDACGWSEDSDGVYRIADDSGRVYVFDPDEWHDDVILLDARIASGKDGSVATFIGAIEKGGELDEE